MIRPSDKGPGRPRPPRTKTPRPTGTGGGGGGGGSTNSGCSLWTFAPPLFALIFLFAAIREALP